MNSPLPIFCAVLTAISGATSIIASLELAEEGEMGPAFMGLVFGVASIACAALLITVMVSR